MFIPAVYDNRHGSSTAVFFVIAIILLALCWPIGALISLSFGVEYVRIDIDWLGLDFYASAVFLSWQAGVITLCVLVFWQMLKSDLATIAANYRKGSRGLRFGIVIITLFYNIPLWMFVGLVLMTAAFGAGYIGYLISLVV